MMPSSPDSLTPLTRHDWLCCEKRTPSFTTHWHTDHTNSVTISLWLFVAKNIINRNVVIQTKVTLNVSFQEKTPVITSLSITIISLYFKISSIYSKTKHTQLHLNTHTYAYTCIFSFSAQHGLCCNIIKLNNTNVTLIFLSRLAC